MLCGGILWFGSYGEKAKEEKCGVRKGFRLLRSGLVHVLSFPISSFPFEPPEGIFSITMLTIGSNIMDGNKRKDPVRRFLVAIYAPVCKVIAFDDPAKGGFS